VGYAAGSPANGGLGNVRLDVVVREQSTGYEEKVSELATIAAAPIHLTLIPESTTFKPSLPFSILVIAETPDKKPVDLAVQLNLSYRDSSFKQLKSDSPRVTTTNGLATLKLTPPADAASISIPSKSARRPSPSVKIEITAKRITRRRSITQESSHGAAALAAAPQSTHGIARIAMTCCW
jgi:hypothetical protein